MLKGIQCLSCGHILFRIGPLDEKGEFWGLYREDQDQYERIHQKQGDKEWYQCPTCHKKNWIASKKIEGKGLQEWISHVGSE